MQNCRVAVTGMAVISALGADLPSTWQRLVTGETGVRQHQPFAELPPRPLGMIGTQPAQLDHLTTAAVQSLLKDSGWETPLPDCAVVLGSSRGHQVRWEQLAQTNWAQTSWAETTAESTAEGADLADIWLTSLPYRAGQLAAAQIGSTGPVLAPMAACATGLWAIAQGYELLQQGHFPQALVGTVEIPITPLTLAGFGQLGALASQGAYPFDAHRDGFVLGEAAALLMLEPLALAQARAAHIYGEILGFGLTADADHITAPSRSQQGAIAAIEQCLLHGLSESRSLPPAIEFIHAHGTATRLNDAAEATLIQRFFPQGVAVSSTKGATGHTLGASGALGAIFSLMALDQQVLPPTWGCNTKEYDLDIVQVARAAPGPQGLQRALCLSFGFGGQNAALMLGRVSFP
jgi:3-oxoacyl-[acyl-carrier-protein] synthase II